MPKKACVQDTTWVKVQKYWRQNVLSTKVKVLKCLKIADLQEITYQKEIDPKSMPNIYDVFCFSKVVLSLDFKYISSLTNTFLL